jgi:hypothetical protein
VRILPWLSFGLALAGSTRAPAPGAPALARPAASAAWVAAGLAWHERRPTSEAAALAGRLDPTWSVPWVYGAMMARRAGDPQAATALLTEGHAARPADPTLPALLGACAHLDGDRQAAASWYRRAAAIPGVPDDLDAIARALEAP